MVIFLHTRVLSDDFLCHLSWFSFVRSVSVERLTLGSALVDQTLNERDRRTVSVTLGHWAGCINSG